MNDWHDLFVATSGAAATLTGLIFVGVSINLTRILSLPKLPERALLALTFLLTILILSILFLIPNQTIKTLGLEVLVMGIIIWGVTIKIDYSIYQDKESKFKKVYLFNVIINQLAVFTYILAGIFLLSSNDKGVYWIVTGFILCFIKSMIDSWVLLVEINR